MHYRDIIEKVNRALMIFYMIHRKEANRIIISRNYIDIIKKEHYLYDIEVMDCNLTFNDIPIIIDECSTSKISVGLILNC